jgi:hypothetical protein
MTRFDKELNELRQEKFKAEGGNCLIFVFALTLVAADLKMLDLKMLILHQELELLKEFEKEDIALAEKLQVKRAEKAELNAKVCRFCSLYLLLIVSSFRLKNLKLSCTARWWRLTG